MCTQRRLNSITQHVSFSCFEKIKFEISNSCKMIIWWNFVTKIGTRITKNTFYPNAKYHSNCLKKFRDFINWTLNNSFRKGKFVNSITQHLFPFYNSYKKMLGFGTEFVIFKSENSKIIIFMHFVGKKNFFKVYYIWTKYSGEYLELRVKMLLNKNVFLANIQMSIFTLSSKYWVMWPWNHWIWLDRIDVGLWNWAGEKMGEIWVFGIEN